MKIEIADSTFSRLQAKAIPLVDTVDVVIVRLLDAYERKEPQMAARTAPNPTTVSVSPTPPDVQKVIALAQLRGFLRELWDLVVMKMPFERFTLRDVYERKGPLAELRPHVKELEASIRAGLEKLRDRGLVEFVDNRGTYRRLA